MYQQQLASNQVLSFQTPGLALNRPAHRRVQSNLPGSGAAFNSVQNTMNRFTNVNGLNLGLDGQTQVPPGHGRRHSVNVVNKSTSQPGTGTASFDGFDDGFTPQPPGGHSRQASRADSSWRISEFEYYLLRNFYSVLSLQTVVLVVFKATVVFLPLTLRKHKHSCKVFNNFVLLQVVITKKWLPSAFLICCQT